MFKKLLSLYKTEINLVQKKLNLLRPHKDVNYTLLIIHFFAGDNGAKDNLPKPQKKESPLNSKAIEST